MRFLLLILSALLPVHAFGAAVATWPNFVVTPGGGGVVQAVTNYFVVAGSGTTIVTNISGTNVTWTITATGGGGGGNMTNSGASTAGNVAVALDGTGTQWTGTNRVDLDAIQTDQMLFSNLTPNGFAYLGSLTNITNAPYIPMAASAALTNLSIGMTLSTCAVFPIYVGSGTNIVMLSTTDANLPITSWSQSDFTGPGVINIQIPYYGWEYVLGLTRDECLSYWNAGSNTNIVLDVSFQFCTLFDQSTQCSSQPTTNTIGVAWPSTCDGSYTFPTSSAVTGMGSVIYNNCTNVPIWNGSAWPGVWADSGSSTDYFGGVVSGANAVSLYGYPARYSVNFLSSVSRPGVCFSIGFNATDPTLIGKGTASVFSFGDAAGEGIISTNGSHDVFSFGYQSASTLSLDNANQVFDYGSASGSSGILKDSFSVFNYGENAGQGIAATNSRTIFNFGKDAGWFASYTNCNFMFNFGDRSGEGVVSINSSDVFTYGQASLFHGSVSNCTDIYTFGQALQQAVITDTTGLFAFGHTAESLVGSYTNVVLIGEGATVGPTAKDQIVTGPTMDLVVGNSISAGTTNKWKTGGYVAGGKVGVTVNNTNYNLLTDADGLIIPATYTVATLPAASSYNGVTVRCSDVLTAWGTGEILVSDGTNWRLPATKIIASANLDTYLVNAFAQSLNLTTPITTAFWGSDTLASSGIGGSFPRRTVVSGAAAAVSGVVADSAYGNQVSLETGSTSTGSAIMHGPYAQALASGDRIATYGVYYVSAVPDGTDNYRVEKGFSGSTTASFSANGAGFLYDPYNSTSHNQSYTNNWICFTRSNSTSAFMDSGLPISISSNTPARLLVTMSTTNVLWYTNGVQCASATTNIPTQFLFTDKINITKTLGGTTRKLFEMSPAIHYRHAARTLP